MIIFLELDPIKNFHHYSQLGSYLVSQIEHLAIQLHTCNPNPLRVQSGTALEIATCTKLILYNCLMALLCFVSNLGRGIYSQHNFFLDTDDLLSFIPFKNIYCEHMKAKTLPNSIIPLPSLLRPMLVFAKPRPYQAQVWLCH